MNISILQDVSVQPNEKTLLVASALRFVIENVFAKSANSFVITVSTGPETVNYWLQDIINTLITWLGFMSLQLIRVDNISQLSILPETRYCNMIMVDSLTSLENTNIAEYNMKEDGLEYYFIFLRTADNRQPKEMERIFRYCFDNFWLHCNIMVQNSKGEVFIYTYFPFKSNRCFETKPQLINKFMDKRFINDIIFPDKLHNLNKCPLKLTTWIIPPFVMNKTNSFFPQTKVGGFEVIIMLAMSRRMNFTLDINLISIDTYHQNKTPETLPMKMVSTYVYINNFSWNYNLTYIVCVNFVYERRELQFKVKSER